MVPCSGRTASPRLQLAILIRGLLGVDLGHPRQLFSIFPPRMVSRKRTCKLSSG